MAIRREIAVDALTAGERPPGWLHRLAGLLHRWPAAVLRPNTLPEDAIWPKLGNYPYP